MSFHVAVIPDGNRRWAKMRGLPVLEGHRQGSQALAQLFEKIMELKIDCFTFWGASLDNLTKRSLEESNFLDELFTEQFQNLIKNETIHQYQIRVRVLGFWPLFLSNEAQQGIKKAMEATVMYSNGMFNLLIAYDGIEEMLRAIQAVVEESRKNPSFILTRQIIKECLLTKDLPPVDLLIRTGGEPHLSAGFMMWDIANAQLFFSEKLWPDFTPNDFEQAVINFRNRERRFGA